jgi:hypothetical protein
VQRILKEDGVRFVQGVGRGEEAVAPPPAGRDEPEAAGPDLGESEPDGFGEAAAAPVIAPTAQRPPKSEPQARAAPTGLTGQDAARLRVALDELLECERVLAALKAPAPQDDELPPD